MGESKALILIVNIPVSKIIEERGSDGNGGGLEKVVIYRIKNVSIGQITVGIMSGGITEKKSAPAGIFIDTGCIPVRIFRHIVACIFDRGTQIGGGM